MKRPLYHFQNSAAEIERLRARCHELVPARDRSAGGMQEWASAWALFRAAYSALSFPGGDEGWLAFWNGQAEGLEAAIEFIDQDPHFFRSGYMKQCIWHRLKQVAVSPAQERRIESVALRYLASYMRREFWHMTRWARIRGSAAFWESVGNLASVGSEPGATRAAWLLLARRNHPVRNWVHRELTLSKHQPGYVANFRFVAPARR